MTMKNKIAIHRHGSRSTVALCKATEGRVCDLSDQGGASGPAEKEARFGPDSPAICEAGQRREKPRLCLGQAERPAVRRDADLPVSGVFRAEARTHFITGRDQS